MRDVVGMIENGLVALTEECIKEILRKFPMLEAKREAVVDWTTNEPWGGTAHQITVANTQIARFEVGCSGTENPMMYRLYRKGPWFYVETEEVEKLLLEL